MCLSNHLFRRGAVYWYRRRTPADLLDEYPDKREFCYSLKTKDPAEAKRKAHIEDVRLDREFEARREGKARAALVRRAATAGQDASPGPDLSDTSIERLATLYFHQALKADEQEWIRALDPDSDEARRLRQEWDDEQALLASLDPAYAPLPYPGGAGLSARTADGKRHRAEFFLQSADLLLSEGRISCMADKVAAFLVSQKLDVKPGTFLFNRLSFAILKKEIEVQKTILQRLDGQWQGSSAAAPHTPPTLPPNGLPVSFAPSTADNPLFSEVWNKYVAERKPIAKTVREFGTAVRRFMELVGDMPVQAVTQSHIRQFKDALARIPVRPPQAVRHMPLPKLIKFVEAEEKRGVVYRTLSQKTINEKGLAVIKTVLSYAVANGYILYNPSTRIRAANKDDSGDASRLPYTTDDLNVIFSSSLFEPSYSMPGMDDAKRSDYQWLIVLALFTGARLEELGQLDVADVKEEQGIAYLFIHGDQETGRRVKNRSSRRKVPVHPRLLDLGFMAFVEGRRQSGGPKLFASLPFTPSSGKYTDAFGKWYSRFTASIKVKSPQKVFHSFRHTFKRAMRDAGVDQALTDAIQGHTSHQGVSGRYGLDAEGMGYSMPVLFEAISKARFEGVAIRPPQAGYL